VVPLSGAPESLPASGVMSLFASPTKPLLKCSTEADTPVEVGVVASAS
jgi:hypothetical protein